MKYLSPQWLSHAAMYAKPINITVVGLGGTGSELVSRLFKMHYLFKKLGGAGFNVTLIDDDIVTAANVGRQNFYEFDIGSAKSEVLARRFNSFSDTQWKYATTKLDKNNFLSLIQRHSIIMTCVDNPFTRCEIGDFLSNSVSDLIWIDGGNDQNTAQVVMGTSEQRNDLEYARLPNVYDLYGEQLKHQEFKDTDSCSHEAAIAKQDFGINDTVAQVMSQLVWQLIRYGELESHGAIINIANFKQSPLPVQPDVWAMFGFDLKNTSDSEVK